jgi:hypothetical protein
MQRFQIHLRLIFSNHSKNMKKIILTFCFLTLIATLRASAQKEQTRQVSGFTAIANNGSFDVKVKVDGTESVRVVSDRNEYDKIETVVENGTLRIGSKRSMGWGDGIRGNVTVYVSAKSLSAIKSNGSGDITVSGDLHGSSAEVSNSGSGEVRIGGNVSGERISVRMVGSGDTRIDGTLEGQNVDVSVTGSGNITTGVKAGDLRAHLTGSGNITLTGSAANASVVVSSSGDIKAQNLRGGNVEASITGSGNIKIGADKTLKLHLSGSGNIVYNGSATISDIHTSGSGSIRKGNDE